MAICAVYGCSHRTGRDTCHFYRFPSYGKGSHSFKLKCLRKERRELWILRIGRKDLTDIKVNNSRVCGHHFVTGSPAALKDVTHVDWAPTLKLGHQLFKREDEIKSEDETSNYSDDVSDMMSFSSVLQPRDAFTNERIILMDNASENAGSDISDNNIFKAEDSVSQNRLSIDDSEPPQESSEDKLKYFVYESDKSNISEDVCIVTHEQALTSAKVLLHYMMNQDDVCQSDLTLVINYIKKISDKLLKEE